MITLTQEAYEYLNPLVDEHGASGVRFEVKGMGCSGMTIVPTFVTTPEEDDIVDMHDDMLIVADPGSSELLDGMTVNLVQDGIAKVLEYDVPKAEGACGCGSSFSFKE